MKVFSTKFSNFKRIAAWQTGINCLIVSLFLVFELIFPERAKCENYSYQLTYGIDDKSFEWGWNGYMKTIWDSGPEVLNDILSDEQEIPFPWKFYGKDVTHYKISDNGYITFDISTSTSYPSNTAIPNAEGPNNAIYVFWRDFEIGANGSNPLYDHVVTWTYGTAPNRIHVIEWQSISTRNNTTQLNAAYFAVRLYESGDFDIVHIWGRYNNAAMAGGTVGVENEDGSLGTMTSKSPNESMRISYIRPQDVPVYRFVYGTQPQYDIASLKPTHKKLIKAGTDLSITGELINYGSQTINSFDLNYKVDDESIQTQHIKDVNLKNNSTYSYTHNIPWTASGTGKMHNISVWASNLNGNNDEQPKNDTIKSSIFVNNGISGSKKALIEEYSTAPCGYCPDGLYKTEMILKNNPNAVGFTHHAGYMTDSMTISESKTYENVFGTGAPMASIDRIWWPGERNINVGRGNNSWENKIAEQLKEATPVDVSIESYWEPGSYRRLNIKATANFLDYPYPGDFRFYVFVIEDSVTGEGSGYDQTNYYSKDNPGGSVGNPSHPYYNLPYKIKGFVHRHVLRAVPSGVWGTEGIIPESPVPGSTYSHEYSYDVPEDFKENDLSIIAFVSYYDPNYKEVAILNTEEHEVIATCTEEVIDLQEIKISPNPVNDCINLSYSNNSGSIEIYSVLGFKVYESEYMSKIDVTCLERGIYFIKVNERLMRFVKM